MNRLALALVAAGAVACGRPGRAALSVPAAPRVEFSEWEVSWLAELAATDPRLALRMPTKPSAEVVERAAAEAVMRGGADVGVAFGAIDMFSFDERARRLDTLRERLTSAPDDGSPSVRVERVLLMRLLDAERLRVARERESPESASERVRAIVATWGRPVSQREVDEREEEVTRGLQDVIPVAGNLRGPRVLELEDALDPLERLAVPERYPRATKLITSLRIELAGAHPRDAALPRATKLASALETQLGARDDERGTLAGRIEEEEASLRAEARALLARLPERASNDVRRGAATHVHETATCPAPAGRSLVRAMAPPPERALVCGALRLASEGTTPLDEAVGVVTLHDDAAIAMWALALDGGAGDLDATRTRHPLLADVSPSTQDRLVREALVSPVRALAPAVTALMLDAEGPSDRASRAKRWLAFGDAPFDVVGDALAGAPSDASGTAH